MVQIVEIEGAEWLDEHRTCDRQSTRVFKVKAPPAGDLAHDLANRTQALGALMDMLALQDERVAITGSAWSQCDLFASPAIRIDTALDKAVWAIPHSALHPNFHGNVDHFAMASGGAKLADVMGFFDERGFSFRTCGSHKGQSIAGAVGTGSHGSLLGEMGLETHVRGMLFVAGSGAKHWIADPDCPVLTDEFINGFATPADTALFDDTVIHLGGFGYLAAILIEAVPRFGLSWKRALAPLSPDWWDAVENADYARAAAPVIGPKEPAFYELTFDPNKPLNSEVMQTCYWRDDDPPAPMLHEEPVPPVIARDALDFLNDAINEFSEQMVASRNERDDDDEEDGLASFTNRLRLLDIADRTFDQFRKDVARQPVSPRPASLYALTQHWKPRQVFGVRIDTFNAALAVPVNELRRTLEIGTDVASHWRKHFVFTVRFATKSRASLSFLRFENTAIINIDGLTRSGIAGWISHSDEFSRAFTDALEEAGVPFSMHWGKDIPSDGHKIAADFAFAVTRFRAARAALVPADIRDKLCPPQLRKWGLD